MIVSLIDEIFCSFEGGLLYTRDSSNLQYVTSSSMLLFIYSNTLTAAHVNGVQCGSAHFSALQIKAFAKSQVDSTSFQWITKKKRKFPNHVNSFMCFFRWTIYLGATP